MVWSITILYKLFLNWLIWRIDRLVLRHVNPCKVMFTSLSVDKMLPKYANGSTNSRDLPVRGEKVPVRLRHKYYVLFAFT